MKRNLFATLTMLWGAFFLASICEGAIHGAVSFTTQGIIDEGDENRSLTYSPIINMSLQEQIARGTSIITGFTALMSGTEVKGYGTTYTGMFFPFFDFITADNQYSLNAGYSHIFSYDESEDLFQVDELSQTQSLYTALSLTPSDIPTLLLNGGRTHSFSEDKTTDNMRNSLGASSNYFSGSGGISAKGGWDRFTDYTNMSGGIAFEENNFNESVSLNFNYQPTTRISMGGSGGVGGYQSERGFGNDIDINRNINFYANSIVSATITDRITTTGNFFWNRTGRESESDGTVTKLEPVESLGIGGGISLELYDFLISNTNYQRQLQINESIRIDSASVGLDFIPLDELKTSLVYGISGTSKKSDRLLRTDTVMVSGVGQPYKKVDVNSVLQYNRSKDYNQDIITTVWKIGPRVKSRLIEDSVVKSLDTEVGYNHQWQIIELESEQEVLIIDVIELAVDSDLTRVIGVTGNWIWNKKPEGLDFTQQYLFEWLPVMNVRLNFQYGRERNADRTGEDGISARVNWDIKQSYTLTAGYRGARSKDSAAAPWDVSHTFSSSISARF